MILSDKQVEFIDQSLSFYGIESKALKEDVTDHICAYIEAREGCFEDLYKDAIEEFGGYIAIKNIQNETKLQLYSEKIKFLKKIVFTLGYLTAVLFIVSYMFKFAHWPFASGLLTISVGFLILVFFPTFLYYNHKQKEYRSS